MRWCARTSLFVKSFILIITVTPLFLGEVVRTYSWIVVLGNNGFINSVLLQLGIIDQPLQLLFTVTGVTIALVHVTLPVVVIMLAAAIAHIDPDYEKAAESLGAGPVRVFLTVTLPLSGPGIVAGLTTAFAWTFSAFATPQLVGGGKVNMVSNLVYQLGFANFNFPFAAALCVAGLALTYVVDRRDARSHCGRSKKSGCTDGAAAVAPRARALPAARWWSPFWASSSCRPLWSRSPPSTTRRCCHSRRSNCRCAGSTTPINYRDFQTGFYNGLIVMLASSFIALFVGAAFAYVIDRYRVSRQERDRRPAAGAAGGAAFHRRPRHADPGRADRRRRAPSRVVIVCHVMLVLPFVLRTSISRCAISISGWSLRPRALAHSPAACS